MKYIAAIVAIAATCTASAYTADNTPHAPGDDIYKHYTGHIGNKKVVIDFRYGFGLQTNYGGFHYYDPETNSLKWVLTRKPEAHQSALTASEFDETDSWGSPVNTHTAATWIYTINGDRLTGKWTSGNRTLDIDLKEDYSSAIPFDILTYTDSAKFSTQDRRTVVVTYDFVAVAPLPGDTHTGITGMLFAALRAGKNNAASYDALPSSLAAHRMQELRKEYNDPANTTYTPAPGIMRRLYQGLAFPVYNQNGLLTMEYYAARTGIIYTTFDANTGRRLAVNDIIKPDAGDQLLTIIRKQYAAHANIAGLRLSPSQPDLGFQLIPSVGGLIFSYMPKPESEHPVNISVPYNDLKDLLTPEFKSQVL